VCAPIMPAHAVPWLPTGLPSFVCVMGLYDIGHRFRSGCARSTPWSRTATTTLGSPSLSGQARGALMRCRPHWSGNKVSFGMIEVAEGAHIAVPAEPSEQQQVAAGEI